MFVKHKDHTCVVCKTRARDFPRFVLLEQVKTAATVPATSICHSPALPTILPTTNCGSFPFLCLPSFQINSISCLLDYSIYYGYDGPKKRESFWPEVFKIASRRICLACLPTSLNIAHCPVTLLLPPNNKKLP